MHGPPGVGKTLTVRYLASEMADATIIVVSGPAVGAAMVVGVTVALFQALTQIQEMTLTFVPKIVIAVANEMPISPTAAPVRIQQPRLSCAGLLGGCGGSLRSDKGRRLQP